jgi:hypothetical protein
MARRIVSGEWLSRDLQFRDVERTRVLSGPSTIAATLDGSVARRRMSDGLPLIDDWGTMIYAVNESTRRIRNCGIVIPPTNYDTDTRIVCAGFSSYPKGLIYRHAKLWGPVAAAAATDAVLDDDGTVLSPAAPAVAEVARPLSIDIFTELWAYAQTNYTNLDVVVTGTTAGGVPIGTYTEPYRLQYWDSPDIGTELETLAQATPFDFVEDPMWLDATPPPTPHYWGPEGQVLWPPDYGSTQDEVRHFVRVGQGRLGKRRDDLRFAVGENIALSPPVSTGENTNMVLGIGNGDPGPGMAQAWAAVEDGRVKRVSVITDKTADQARITEITNRALRNGQARPQVESVAVVDHPNARISDIQLGDDIYVEGDHPQYGYVGEWVRVLSMAQGDSDLSAVLSVRDSTTFTYGSQ